MEKKYYKNYRYYGFYQKIFDSTKVIIEVKIDNATGYIGMSEMNGIGKLTEKEIELLAIKRIKEIESYV